MDTTPDSPDSTATDGSFDPRQAAALLDETTQQARRRTEPYPPWLLAIRAVLALALYGAIWLSVRGQHPYRYPTTKVMPVVAVLVVINLVATLAVARHATAGVRGRSRLRPAEIAGMTVIWIGLFAAVAIMAGAGVSDRIVYGIFPAAVPLIVAGVAWAGVTTAHGNWRGSGTAVAVVIVGAAAVFAGPAGAWAVAGVGLFIVLLGTAAVIAGRQRRSVVRP